MNIIKLNKIRKKSINNITKLRKRRMYSKKDIERLYISYPIINKIKIAYLKLVLLLKIINL